SRPVHALVQRAASRAASVSESVALNAIKRQRARTKVLARFVLRSFPLALSFGVRGAPAPQKTATTDALLRQIEHQHFAILRAARDLNGRLARYGHCVSRLHW